MSALDIAALVVIFFLLVLVTVIIVVLGSLPGKIAHKRGHPCPDAVNAASWIGLATGVFWPVAFIWAFLPVPGRGREDGGGAGELAELRQRLEALERATAGAPSTPGGDAS